MILNYVFSNYTSHNAYFSFLPIKLLHEIVMLINDISVFRRFYTNFIASLWQQGKIQKVEKEHTVIYNIITVHKKEENKH